MTEIKCAMFSTASMSNADMERLEWLIEHSDSFVQNTGACDHAHGFWIGTWAWGDGENTYGQKYGLSEDFDRLMVWLEYHCHGNWINFDRDEPDIPEGFPEYEW